MSQGLAPLLTLCLWAGLLISSWDPDFGVASQVAATLLLALILTPPAAGAVALVWRCGEAMWDATWWTWYRRRYPRR